MQAQTVELILRVTVQVLDVLAVFLMQPSLFAFVFGKRRLDVFVGALRRLTDTLCHLSARSIWRFGILEVSPTERLPRRLGLVKLKRQSPRYALRMSRQTFVFAIKLLTFADEPGYKLHDRELTQALEKAWPPLWDELEYCAMLKELFRRAIYQRGTLWTLIGDLLREQGTVVHYARSVWRALVAAVYYDGLLAASIYVLARLWPNPGLVVVLSWLAVSTVWLLFGFAIFAAIFWMAWRLASAAYAALSQIKNLEEIVCLVRDRLGKRTLIRMAIAGTNALVAITQGSFLGTASSLSERGGWPA